MKPKEGANMADYEKLKEEYRKNSDYDNQPDEKKKQIDDAWDRYVGKQEKKDEKQENKETKSEQPQQDTKGESGEKTKEDPRWKQLKDDYYKNHDYEHSSDERKKQLDDAWDKFVKKKKNEEDNDGGDNQSENMDKTREIEPGKKGKDTDEKKQEKRAEETDDKKKKQEGQDRDRAFQRNLQDRNAHKKEAKEHRDRGIER